MNPRLSVVVQVDVDGRHVVLAVMGTLTSHNQQALPPLVARARTLFPEAGLTVDLEQARAAEPAALDLLARSLRDGHPGTVRITAPDHRKLSIPAGPRPAADAGIVHHRRMPHLSRRLDRARTPGAHRPGPHHPGLIR